MNRNAHLGHFDGSFAHQEKQNLFLRVCRMQDKPVN